MAPTDKNSTIRSSVKNYIGIKVKWIFIIRNEFRNNFEKCLIWVRMSEKKGGGGPKKWMWLMKVDVINVDPSYVSYCWQQKFGIGIWQRHLVPISSWLDQSTVKFKQPVKMQWCSSSETSSTCVTESIAGALSLIFIFVFVMRLWKVFPMTASENTEIHQFHFPLN